MYPSANGGVVLTASAEVEILHECVWNLPMSHAMDAEVELPTEIRDNKFSRQNECDIELSPRQTVIARVLLQEKAGDNHCNILTKLMARQMFEELTATVQVNRRTIH